ncbi:FAD-dependent oxidoreductase [Streptomyces sp. NA02950]|uniref:FAD-dependent oxidoreductase n=1 Tax=Streptomyces sp. NA02950 TaxID=2742137 RepID=UPI00158FB4B0|nr:FAD-dependent oxidoreductase [Streptomyces sp. NA02950]QKV97067.1 FAD-dependent oxidoreductase [Streptomyces sp. NA02950]
MTTVDAQTVVVGAGAIGSATAYWLAERGQTDVVVLEQYDLGHGNGASQDHSRAIRHSYHDNAYGRLTQAAFDNWDRLAKESGQQVLLRTGGVEIGLKGTPGEEMIARYRKVLDDQGHAYERWDNARLAEHYPQWRVEEPAEVTFTRDMGLVDIGKAGQTHRALAAALGVTFRPRTRAVRIETLTDAVRVHTDDGGSVVARDVVVAAGAWSDDILAEVGQTWRTTISQEQVAYFVPKVLRDFTPEAFPVWGWYGPTLFYGFPVYGEVAVKIARDMSGRFVTHQTRSLEPVAEETELLETFLRERLPEAAGFELYSKTCIYDMPPDRNFVIDAMPGNPRVVVGIGAGHAAKFAGLFGEILSQLVVEGRSRYPIEPFRADRPALKDPSFRSVFGL